MHTAWAICIATMERKNYRRLIYYRNISDALQHIQDGDPNSADGQENADDGDERMKPQPPPTEAEVSGAPAHEEVDDHR